MDNHLNYLIFIRQVDVDHVVQLRFYLCTLSRTATSTHGTVSSAWCSSLELHDLCRWTPCSVTRLVHQQCGRMLPNINQGFSRALGAM